MSTLLPRDDDNQAIQALRLKDNGAHSITVSSLASRNSTAFSVDTKVISLFSTGPIYVRLGDSSVTATPSDHYFPAGIYYDIAITGGHNKGAQDTYVSALQVESGCTLYISEKV